MRVARRYTCSVCTETGGIVAGCRDCDFDLCYDCYLKEGKFCDECKKVQCRKDCKVVNGTCLKCKEKVPKGCDKCSDMKASRKSEFSISSPSILDDSRLVKSTKYTFKDGHSEKTSVICLCIPPVNFRKTLATTTTASDDGTVCIWSLLSGSLTRRLESEHEGATTAVQLYQNPLSEKEVSTITGGEDKVVVWNYNSGKKIVDLYSKEKSLVPLGTATGLLVHHMMAQTSSGEKAAKVLVTSVDEEASICTFDYQKGPLDKSFKSRSETPIRRVVVCT